MRAVSVLIKPASASCQLNCEYCFYKDVSVHREVNCKGMMNHQTMTDVIDKILEFAGEKGCVSFGFQGGEPLLAGYDFFERFFQKVKEKRKDGQQIQYSIQTNALLIDRKYCELFKKNDVLLGVSLDGFQQNHDFYRLDSQGNGSFEDVMKAIELLKEYDIQFNILTVLSQKLAQYPERLYQFYKENNLKYVQLIPCISGLDNENEFAITPERFATFYLKLLQCWKEDEEGINIGLFEDLAMMLSGLPPLTCGNDGKCVPQLIIEADGDCYPCDFYALDQYLLGNIKENSVEKLLYSPKARQFALEQRKNKEQCARCEYCWMCAGGCKRLSKGFLSKEYCGLKPLLEEIKMYLMNKK